MRTLSTEEIRVLACLVEKEWTTPEYYPLTLRALVGACNQKSNRYPVMDLTEADVQECLNALRKEKLVARVEEHRSRVPKFAHKFSETLELDQQQTAILTELMLRGPQTMGEIKARASRMYPFERMIQVESAIRNLSQREQGPLVVQLPRGPGQKEYRYAHLLGEAVDASTAAAASDDEREPLTSEPRGGLQELASEVAELRQQLRDLQQAFESFRDQFQ